MAPYSIPYPFMPDLDQLEKMNQDLTRMMPKEMASAVNLLAHPVAGAAAMSALGFGLANHAFGVWLGVLSGAADASQRLFHPVAGEFAADAGNAAAKNSATRARAATKTLIAEAQSFAREVTDIATGTAGLEQPAATTEAPAALMPEDFRQPKAIDRPAMPADLKAISGVGPKLEQTLNAIGIFHFWQLAGLTAAQVEELDGRLAFKGRIARDRWVEQAVELAKESAAS